MELTGLIRTEDLQRILQAGFKPSIIWDQGAWLKVTIDLPDWDITEALDVLGELEDHK